MNTTATAEHIAPLDLKVGDRVDAGGTRRNATVYDTPIQWGTGSISVLVNSRGRISQVWFKGDTKATRIATAN